MANKTETTTEIKPTDLELIKALISFQKDLKPIAKNATNPHFKSGYADLAQIMSHIMPLLAKNNLVITQPTNWVDGKLFLETWVMHSSGARLGSTMPVEIDGKNPQHLGSYLSYLRRYAVSSMLGVTQADEDDDAHASTTTTTYATTRPPTTTPTRTTPTTTQSTWGGDPRAAAPRPTTTTTDVISIPQLKRLLAIGFKRSWTRDELSTLVQDGYGVSLERIARADYEEICGFIERHDPGTKLGDPRDVSPHLTAITGPFDDGAPMPSDGDELPF